MNTKLTSLCALTLCLTLGCSDASPTKPINTADMREATPDMVRAPEMSAPTPDMLADMKPAARRPNILLIIADDQGLDASTQYSAGSDLPKTPIIDQLATQGIIFDNAWATPSCTTTRGTLISGLHGVHSGVDTVPDLLPTSTLTIQAHLKARSSGYASAIVGKWHLGGQASDLNGPANAGVEYYAGTITGTIEDYLSWPLTINGQQTTSTGYHTTVMTDLALDWIKDQEQPWFMWLAYVAPHLPFHLPPANLHTQQGLSGTPADIRANPRPYYLAAIEAMDTEIGRLLESLPPGERENTIIIYLGDNGTPTQTVDTSVFPRDHAKNTLYEGGVRVPFIVSGAGVNRASAREQALINTADVFPTLLELIGVSAPAQPLDGVSFAKTLTDEGASARQYNYTEFVSAAVTGWAVRDDTYKLIEFADGTRELYNLKLDLQEQNNLITLPEHAETVAALATYAASRRAN